MSVEGGEESQQALRGRNRGTCLEMVWVDQEMCTQKDMGSGEEHCTGSEAQIETFPGVRRGKFEGSFRSRNTIQMAGFEPHFQTEFPWNMEYVLFPAFTSGSLCLYRKLCLLGPCTTLRSASRSQTKSVTKTPLPLREGDFTATCVCLAACLWNGRGWGVCSYPAVNKKNKCQQHTMKWPMNLSPDANTLPVRWLIYQSTQGWDLTIEKKWNTDWAGASVSKSKSAGSHFPSSKMKRLLFLAKKMFWTSGVWKQLQIYEFLLNACSHQPLASTNEECRSYMCWACRGRCWDREGQLSSFPTFVPKLHMGITTWRCRSTVRSKVCLAQHPSRGQ